MNSYGLAVESPKLATDLWSKLSRWRIFSLHQNCCGWFSSIHPEVPDMTHMTITSSHLQSTISYLYLYPSMLSFESPGDRSLPTTPFHSTGQGRYMTIVKVDFGKGIPIGSLDPWQVHCICWLFKKGKSGANSLTFIEFDRLPHSVGIVDSANFATNKRFSMWF